LDFDYTQALVYFNEAQNTLSMIDNKTTKTLSISAYCFNESGMILLKLKQYTNAISHFTKSIEKIANLQDHRPQTAIYTNNLGMCYFENGDPAMALQHFKSSEKLEKRIFGNDYLKLIKRYINIGNCFSKLGDQAKAEFYYETALAKAIKDSKSNFPDVGVAKSNLGLHLLSRNENQQAIALLKDALSADKAFYGRSHPTVAKRHFNLGHALIQNEKYELAIRELEDALEIESQILDGNHPDLAITLEELAQAYLSSRDFLKSYNCLDGALAINLKNFGKNSYEVALNFKITGLVHLESGQNNSGITYLLDSIRIAENLPTKPIGLILELYNILGNYYSSIQDTLLSEKNFNKVLKLLEKESSIKNPSTANIYCSLGHYFNSKQDFNKAYNCFYEAFNIDTKFFPNDHPNNIRDRHYLAEALYDLGENKKSIELIRLNIKILDKLPRERGEEYIREYNFLGLIYYESGEFEKAINKYRRAFMLANKFLGGSDEITIKIKTQLNDAITASRRR
jgi:tetratricopeptide (TPR) repeat protein